MIRDGAVLTVVESAAQPTTPGFTFVNCDGTAVGPGWTWNGATFAMPANPVSIAARDFWRRFTAAEREALQNILATGTQVQKNKLNAFRDYVAQGGNVELNDDYIIASVNLMETAGILVAGRAATILTP
jgi:hypothetical protein